MASASLDEPNRVAKCSKLLLFVILESIWPFIGPPKSNPDPSLAAQPKRDSGSSWEGYGGALGSGRALGRLWELLDLIIQQKSNRKALLLTLD